MPSKFKNTHRIFGENANEDLANIAYQVAIACNTLKNIPETSVKFSRKYNAETSQLPYSILKIQDDDRMRYFAVNNHLLDGKAPTNQGNMEEGEGGSAYVKAIRELLPTESNGQIIDVQWAPINDKSPMLGFKRVKTQPELMKQYQKKKISHDQSTKESDEDSLNKNVAIFPQAGVLGQMVLEEAQALKHIQRTAITFTLTSGSEKVSDPKSYLITDYYSGGDLLSRMSNGLSVQSAQQLCAKLLANLNTLHRKYRALHKDIKPANICFDEKGKVHFVDFGAAQMMDKNSGCKDGLCGTPGYMAPELLVRDSANKLHYTVLSDGYALGKVFSEVLNNVETTAGSDPESDALRFHLRKLAMFMQKDNLDERLSPKAAATYHELAMTIYGNTYLQVDQSALENRVIQCEDSRILVSLIEDAKLYFDKNKVRLGQSDVGKLQYLKKLTFLAAKQAHSLYPEDSSDRLRLRELCGFKLSRQGKGSGNSDEYDSASDFLLHQHTGFSTTFFGQSKALTDTAAKMEEVFSQPQNRR
ncbi:MAG: hypothetical protein DHS20C10_12640 [marine bacterium B5-7]|nr:MAG: hypothetical protein DHS20C10_12640 [marine bacterium B5-7]